MPRILRWSAVVALVMTFLVAIPAIADARAREVTVSAPASAVEGERFVVTARIASPGRATKVEFQIFSTDILGRSSWRRLRTLKVRKHRTRSIPVLAGEESRVRLRAVVTYKGSRKKVVSRPVVVNYWHWVPITSFTHYAASGGVIDSSYVSFMMNGRSWKGWYSYGTAESRYTLGRNCTRFKGYAGLTDRSADGSAGTVTLSVVTPQNTVEPVWVSPALHPGVLVPVDLRLAAPYRFAIAGQNTSTPIDDRGTLPAAYPAIGDAELLCHFAQ